MFTQFQPVASPIEFQPVHNAHLPTSTCPAPSISAFANSINYPSSHMPVAPFYFPSSQPIPMHNAPPNQPLYPTLPMDLDQTNPPQPTWPSWPAQPSTQPTQSAQTTQPTLSLSSRSVPLEYGKVAILTRSPPSDFSPPQPFPPKPKPKPNLPVPSTSRSPSPTLSIPQKPEETKSHSSPIRTRNVQTAYAPPPAPFQTPLPPYFPFPVRNPFANYAARTQIPYERNRAANFV